MDLFATDFTLHTKFIHQTHAELMGHAVSFIHPKGVFLWDYFSIIIITLQQSTVCFVYHNKGAM